MARSYDFKPADLRTAMDEKTNANAVVTITPGSTDVCTFINRILFSYDAAPPAGSTLTVTVGGTTVLKQAVFHAGLGPVDLGGIIGAANQTVVVTLTSGGVGVKTYLFVSYW